MSQRSSSQFKWPANQSWPSAAQVEWQEPRTFPVESQAQLFPVITSTPDWFFDTSTERYAVIGKQPVRWKKGKLRKQRSKKAKWARRIVVAVSLMTVISLVLGTQLNGEFGAGVADTMRAIFGPTITAQVESWFLGISDKAHQVQYQLGGQQVQAPWSVTHSYQHPVSGTVSQSLMPLVTIKPVISPALPGEGTWVTDGMPPSTGNLPPLVAKTFIRPDASRPYAIVTLLQFDMRNLALHMIAGTTEPGGARGVRGPGAIPSSDMQQVFAAFNGGFKYADGQFG
ncbi:MAG TPA: hypothetical protein VGT44_06805, partial [Ktedonobacteraceae bacterium]|nr:hypothetical protein [Ktedonobacteraceae bacterium]